MCSLLFPVACYQGLIPRLLWRREHASAKYENAGSKNKQLPSNYVCAHDVRPYSFHGAHVRAVYVLGGEIFTGGGNSRVPLPL